MHVAIAGNIGSGKTTLTEKLSKHYKWTPHYEDVEKNPYLNDFYKEMQRWSFNLQIFFLHHRFATHIKMTDNESGAIQDRTIYEDVSIFAYNLYKMGTMSKRDWETYKNLFDNMTQFLEKPDLIIYLRASTDTLINRIKSRNRNYEKDIDRVYLHRLNIYYKNWFSSIKEFNVLEIDTNNFNIFKDLDKLNKICDDIKNKLNKL